MTVMKYNRFIVIKYNKFIVMKYDKFTIMNYDKFIIMKYNKPFFINIRNFLLWFWMIQNFQQTIS